MTWWARIWVTWTTWESNLLTSACILARSDPALNYGMLSVTLLNKIALQRLERVEQATGVTIYPIIGVGGVPFRGKFRPGFVDSVLEEYPSVQTFTMQSSFKFDHEPSVVRGEIAKLMERQRGSAFPIDETRALELVGRYTACYQEHVERLAPLVNALAPCIPGRRDRRLHIGLYGYSRAMNSPDAKAEVHLPRAITFCAALYSVGVPPELLALESLRPEDLDFLQVAYPHFMDDVAAAARYANEESTRRLLGEEAWRTIVPYIRDVDQEHRGLATLIADRVEGAYDMGHTKQLAV